jgi:hypothetical protein
MSTLHQSQSIILIPPNHEQSWPSFHVEHKFLQPLLDHLKTYGIEPMQGPEPLGDIGPEGCVLYEVEVSDDYAVAELEGILLSFMEQQGIARS